MSWTHVSADLMRAIRAQYRLNPHGLHGLAHWLRVRENGLRLAEATGADIVVVEHFAALHDACRLTDGRDIEPTGTKTDDLTIATCWDADRLDLLRVGVMPDPRYLVTEAARNAEVIEWACSRASAW